MSKVSDKSKSHHKARQKKKGRQWPLREFYFDHAGHKIIKKTGFYWAMNHTKGIRGIYHQEVLCSICGRIDSDGYLYKATETIYVALCSQCKYNMKNGPGLHIIYTPMK